MIFSPATAYPFDATTVDVEPFVGPCILHGWSFEETTELARARVKVFDGPTGARIVPVSLSAGQSTRDWLSGTGIYVNTSLFVQVLAGTVEGTFWCTPMAERPRPVPIDVHEMIDNVLETLAWSRQ